MNETSENIREVFEKRMSLVGEISRLNAEQLLNTQKLSGNQVDLMRCTDAVRAEAASGQLHQELAAAKDRDALLKSRIADCEDKIRVLEEQVAALDRKLETL